jgi:asparagine synthase (glutamine-hydrolysing)
MVSQDGDTVIVFNGEIYNTRNYGVSWCRLRCGHCDTELVLAGFANGTRCFRRLRGMLPWRWTESASRLLLARDRMGIKPLYWPGAVWLYFGPS